MPYTTVRSHWRRLKSGKRVKVIKHKRRYKGIKQMKKVANKHKRKAISKKRIEEYRENIRLAKELIKEHMDIVKGIPESPSEIGKKFEDKVSSSKIKKSIAPIKKEFTKNCKAFSLFLLKDQDIIYHQLKKENIEPEIYLSKFKIINISPDKLPMTIIEQEIYYPYCKERDYIWHLNKVEKIEKNIIEKGFESDHPLLLYYMKEPYPSITLAGGNHRLQAIRNLISRGKLPKSFKVPAVFIYNSE
nr:MAG: hypothetical protein [uncultured archaeon]